MKRKLLLFLAIAATMALQASDICIDGIYYLFEGDEAVVTYKGAIHYEDMKFYHDTVTIPEKVTYNDKVYPVTQIGEGAFWCCDLLTHVVIPNSVKVIETSAFYFSSIEHVVIPDGVDSIGNNAFGLLPIKELTIGKGLRVVSASSFFNAPMTLKKIEISPCNPYLTSGEDCNAIIDRQTKVLLLGCVNTYIPTYVTELGTSCFDWCSDLETITIPQNVTRIGDGAFAGCGNLYEIHMGRSLKSIGSMAFDMCIGLLDVYCYAPVPPVFDDEDYGFGDEYEVMPETIYVPKGKKGIYGVAIGWDKYENYKEITVPADVPEDVMPPIKCEETDLDIIPVNNELSTRKVIRNGRLFLYNNEHIYTITGAKLQ